MNKHVYWLLAVSLPALAACNKSEPGGGAVRSAQFTMEGPAMTATIQQGSAHTVTLRINRGQDFNQTVRLQAEAPKGVQAVLSDQTVNPSETGEVKLEIAVSRSAATGEQMIRVIGTPTSGAATILEVKIKVTERAETMRLTLKGPSEIPAIKQGEVKAVTIQLEPPNKYLADIKLTATAPKGIRVELQPNTIRADYKSDTRLVVTVDKNAPLGEHTVHLSGTADAATVAPIDVRISVVAQ